ncbi:uncharacterized protein LOC112350410 isoform X2 [Selaginella moellendorffii]|uniref:uncharacterized protein LOC112350410 isoform X2 n=1 Tax=Selaginella moellendorffii TaxID=88036 RepID=UPI000D1CAD51|nr:uncharacterized protein LOC112350410 isoform X2 [Selaginella moellendorffii]|eukprot:XP_024542360.1 uncharacterized protein LOC112350410 isoform X2 [Selaginella moellendorffii]
MGIEGDGKRRADETRIRRLQKILGSKRASPTLSGCSEVENDPIKKLSTATQSALNDLKLEVSKMRNDLEKLTEEVHAAKKLEAESKGTALDMEKRFTAQMEEFQRSLASLRGEVHL